MIKKNSLKKSTDDAKKKMKPKNSIETSGTNSGKVAVQ